MPLMVGNNNYLMTQLGPDKFKNHGRAYQPGLDHDSAGTSNKLTIAGIRAKLLMIIWLTGLIFQKSPGRQAGKITLLY